MCCFLTFVEFGSFLGKLPAFVIITNFSTDMTLYLQSFTFFLMPFRIVFPAMQTHQIPCRSILLASRIRKNWWNSRFFCPPLASFFLESYMSDSGNGLELISCNILLWTNAQLLWVIRVTSFFFSNDFVFSTLRISQIILSLQSITYPQISTKL